MRSSLSTICGSDIHFLRDFPLPRGVDHQPMGHEAVGRVVAVGEAVRRFRPDDRVVAACLYGCGSCANCQRGQLSICTSYGRVPGLTNTLSGCQGEYFRVPHADLNMEHVPDGVSDESAILAGDVMSTGFAAVERGGVSTGDSVAIFAQGPVGLCATAGARLHGAGLVIAVEGVPERAEMARRMGASVVLEPGDAAVQIRALTGDRGVDVAIEAYGGAETFRAAVEATGLDGTVSSLGVYAGHHSLDLPIDRAFYQRRVVTSLCPVGSDRLRRLLAVAEHGAIDLSVLFTHRWTLSRVIDAYDLFEHRRDGVIKIALTSDD